MILKLRKFEVDLAKLRAQDAVQRDEDRAVMVRVHEAMVEPGIEVFREERLLLLEDLQENLRGTVLGADKVIRLREAITDPKVRRWRIWADVKTGVWPVWFHPYSLLVYHEEHA